MEVRQKIYAFCKNFIIMYFSDVSGGHSPSILDAMRAAMASSRALSFTQPDDTDLSITYHEAFYMGTLGGAKGVLCVCNMYVTNQN